MISILIITHGPLAAAILKSAELLMGSQKDVEIRSLNHGDNIDEFSSSVSNAIAELGKKGKVLVLVDMLGGSPANVSAVAMATSKFKCVTGVNLPMLIEALNARETTDDLDILAKQISEVGMNGIRDLGEILSAQK